MRRAFATILILFVLLSPSLAAEAPLHEGDIVAICGDSITEQKQYSVFIENYLLACKPKPNLHAMQFGWGGEVVGGFLGRISNVLRFPVTVATTFYGMNDGGYAPLTPERAQKYRDGQKTIIDTFKKSGVRLIVVGSPGVVDSKLFKKDPAQAAIYNKTLSELRDIAKEVATAEGVAFADVHATMLDAMAKAKAKYGEDYEFAGGDGVHPGRNGHLVTAYAFLKALGCDGEIGTITVDFAGAKAEATEGHKVLSVNGGAVEVESSRYPFCFSGDPKTPSATNGIIEFIPFNQDLNRFRLVVNNPGGEKIKVTWGAATKEYAAADLAKGINLAAEFLENPFSEPFAKLEETVRAQQNYETTLVKQFLPSLMALNQAMPEEKEALDKVTKTAMAKAKTLNDASSAAVVPVKHVIKLEVIGAPAPAPAPAPAAPPAPAPAPEAAPAPAPAPAPAAPAPEPAPAAPAPAPAAPAPAAPAPAPEAPAPAAPAAPATPPAK